MRSTLYDAFQADMHDAALTLAPVLRDCLGPKFDQHYPACGARLLPQHPEVRNVWQHWACATYRWREISEAFKRDKSRTR